MIHTLTFIRFLFPFLLLLAFFCLYKKEYRCMKSFMWRMVVFDSARKFYVSIMMLTLIFINWCCCMTDPNLAVGLSSILTLALLNRRIADGTLHILHKRKRFWFITLLIAMVWYVSLPIVPSCASFGLSVPSSSGVLFVSDKQTSCPFSDGVGITGEQREGKRAVVLSVFRTPLWLPPGTIVCSPTNGKSSERGVRTLPVSPLVVAEGLT